MIYIYIYHVPLNIEKEQRLDPIFKELIDFHEQQITPYDCKNLQLFLQRADTSFMQDGLLYFSADNK